MLAPLSAVICAALSASRVLLVADSPDVANYGHGGQVLAAAAYVEAAAGGAAVDVLLPDCPDCSQLPSLPARDGLRLLMDASWSSGEAGSAVSDWLAINGVLDDKILVVSVDARLPADLVAQWPGVSFVELIVDSSDGSRALKAINHLSLSVRTTNAAYLNGALAAIATHDRNPSQKNATRVAPVAFATPADPTASGRNPAVPIQAYRQGVGDVSSVATCSMVVRLGIRSTRRAADFDAAAYDDVLGWARGVFSGMEYKAVHADLGPYNTAVLQAAREAAAAAGLPPFASTDGGFVSTGTDLGAFPSKDALEEAWLGTGMVDWERLIALVTQSAFGLLEAASGEAAAPAAGALPDLRLVSSIRDHSVQSWVSSYGSGISVSAGLVVAQERTCTATQKRNVATTLTSMYVMLQTEAFALSDVSTSPTVCSTLPLNLPSMRRAASTCLVDSRIRIVGVGLYLHTIGSIDMRAGSFYADYSLYLIQGPQRYATARAAYNALTHSSACASDEPCGCPDFGAAAVPFIPAARASKVLQDVSLLNVFPVTQFPVWRKGSNSTVIDHHRISGTHYFSPDASMWPTDTQKMSVFLENTEESTSDDLGVQFCHLEAYTGVSPSNRFFPGLTVPNSGQTVWTANLNASCWPAMTYPEFYRGGSCPDGIAPVPVAYTQETLPLADASCTCRGGSNPSSRYEFAIFFERPRLPSFFRGFLPPIFVTVVSQGVWFLHPAVFRTRLGVC
eukprot:gene23215-35572_t